MRNNEGLFVKMQINLIKNEQGTDEWLMVEMQGSIENGDLPLSGEMIGTTILHFINRDGNILFF
uniref:PLAT domain-containing protein n=1 Tax=Heterorhabditis bacteriophora TaxID=37862 RepID=A0A1I7XCW2_HETBA